jgi:hypothetical protein
VGRQGLELNRPGLKGNTYDDILYPAPTRACSSAG